MCGVIEALVAVSTLASGIAELVHYCKARKKKRKEKKLAKLKAELNTLDNSVHEIFQDTKRQCPERCHCQGPAVEHGHGLLSPQVP